MSRDEPPTRPQWFPWAAAPGSPDRPPRPSWARSRWFWGSLASIAALAIGLSAWSWTAGGLAAIVLPSASPISHLTSPSVAPTPLVVTRPGSTITIPGPIETAPGAIVTVPGPGPTVTVTQKVPGPTVTVFQQAPAVRVTVTQAVPGPTVTVTQTARPPAPSFSPSS